MPSRRLSGRGCQYSFKQETGSEPEGGKVQTNQMSDIPAAAAVIPRTDLQFRQQRSGGEFCEIDPDGVDTASPQSREVF